MNSSLKSVKSRIANKVINYQTTETKLLLRIEVVDNFLQFQYEEPWAPAVVLGQKQ